MKNKLKVIGHFNGDKHKGGKLPNLKLGEVRYYPQDNPNIMRNTVREISSRTLVRIFRDLFPEHIVDIDEQDNRVNNIRCECEDDVVSYIINKAYICIKEATQECDGTIAYLHDGYVLIYKERVCFVDL
ncbi:hypothetical protein [Sulfuricurvum sp.]|uniref:hypothetical protein n=1 Tax=Sulfuricurvum sp. TaxID=2025608 RepID=UPI003BB7F408